MVYCTKCGTFNAEGAINCSNCGALLSTTSESRPYRSYQQRRDYSDGYRHRHGGGGFGLLIAGLFIVIIGIAALTGFSLFWTYFWPIVLVLIGLWILLLGLRRNRRYRQGTPQ